MDSSYCVTGVGKRAKATMGGRGTNQLSALSHSRGSPTVSCRLPSCFMGPHVGEEELFFFFNPPYPSHASSAKFPSDPEVCSSCSFLTLHPLLPYVTLKICLSSACVVVTKGDNMNLEHLRTWNTSLVVLQLQQA